jgi:anti-sigma regulatory factor (Ser/Thr protein kinase)
VSQQIAALTAYAGTSAEDVPWSTTEVIPAAHPGVTTHHVRLAALPSAVPWARRVVRHALREQQLEKLSDTALLLVSELVTNAVQASACPGRLDRGRLQMITLSLLITDTSLVTEVRDASRGVPAVHEVDPTGDDGRGLLLVDVLADAWGHRPTDDGKVVWCTISVPE